jgi:hypothetical protein
MLESMYQTSPNLSPVVLPHPAQLADRIRELRAELAKAMKLHRIALAAWRAQTNDEDDEATNVET